MWWIVSFEFRNADLDRDSDAAFGIGDARSDLDGPPRFPAPLDERRQRISAREHVAKAESAARVGCG